jgi:hypothetical protein
MEFHDSNGGSKACSAVESIVVKWIPLEFYCLSLSFCQLLERCTNLRNVQLLGESENEVIQKFFRSLESRQVPAISLYLWSWIPSVINLASLKSFIFKDKLHTIDMLVVAENSSYIELLKFACQSTAFFNLIISFRNTSSTKLFWHGVEGIWSLSAVRKIKISSPLLSEEDFESMVKGISQAQQLECLELGLSSLFHRSHERALPLWQFLKSIHL